MGLFEEKLLSVVKKIHLKKLYNVLEDRRIEKSINKK